ncbi:MarR family winged helix-turn-helix transcriptional regulator [Sneathiella glossodoripedis]|uniref:MarR family winged helix-turn-helix transcriptional regulator n=1 Tax=Sneathiella glossodoripedis TaxID=418853 RepID=UPI00068450F0|nr:MarR family transcriptional regulator [Sneathiella glossodoripedis]
MIDLHAGISESEAIDSDEKQRLRLWLRLLKVSRHIEGELRERLRRQFGSTLPRFDVLAALFRSDTGLKMSELSSALRVSNGNVTGIIERLVGEGLVEREAIPGDRRAMRVKLTKEGRSDFSHMAEVHRGWINELLAGIDAADAELISQLLDMGLVSDGGPKDGENK